MQLVAKTEFVPPTGVAWTTDIDGGQALAEFEGLACHQAWYLQHILEVGHFNVLEHGTVLVDDVEGAASGLAECAHAVVEGGAFLRGHPRLEPPYYTAAPSTLTRDRVAS